MPTCLEADVYTFVKSRENKLLFAPEEKCSVDQLSGRGEGGKVATRRIGLRGGTRGRRSNKRGKVKTFGKCSWTELRHRYERKKPTDQRGEQST